MSANISQRAMPGVEMLETMTGSDVELGVFNYPPVHVIFDNLGEETVTIFINGTQWKTFGPLTAVILDMRANHGAAPNYCFSKGDVIVGNGAGGDFSVSWTYAKE